MTRFIKRTIFYSLVFSVLAPALSAQDLHFSQFYLQPSQLTPAQTGIFQGLWRGAVSYRRQWHSVPVSYETFTGAFDWKVIRRDKNLVAAGLQLSRDEAGDAALTWTQIGLNASVAHALSENQALSVGFGVGMSQRGVDISGLKFKNQWNGDVYDPGLPTQESFNRSSGFSPTLSAGLNWRLESAENRDRLDVGLGAFHLNRPRINFRDDAEQRLPMRYALILNGIFQMSDLQDLVCFGAVQQMSTAREIVGGLGLRRWISIETAVQLSLAWRAGDAVIPAVQLEHNSWTFGFSYDWNISRFDAATQGRGGPELALVYRALPAPPVKTFKSCPIF